MLRSPHNPRKEGIMPNGYCPICNLCTRVTSGHYAAGGTMCGCDPKDRHRKEIEIKIDAEVSRYKEERLMRMIDYLVDDD